MLKEKIVELKEKLIAYALLVESMLEKSMRGLTQKKAELLKEVMDVDEKQADENDIVIDEACATIIAQFEPVAVDLRTVLMILKMNKDLERMADHVVNICESNIYLIQEQDYRPSEDILVMAKASMGMVKDSIKAFVNLDAELANLVCDLDNIVDERGDKILRELIDVMKGKKDEIRKSLHIMRISHNLERIADLSTNLCEEIIYIVEGKDIKHHHLDS